MRKSFLLKSSAFILGGMMFFASCNKDDDNGGSNGGNSGNAFTIKATNVINGSTQIATVKIYAEWFNGGDYSEDAIAQAPYKNNGFTLELPVTLADKYLTPIYEDELNDVAISDKNVKWFFLEDIWAYDGNEKEMGYFFLENQDGEKSYFTSWIYVDRNVTVKGEEKWIEYGEEYIDIYDWNLKKGWNVIYGSSTRSYNNSTGRYVDTFSSTSQKPSSVNYSWYFYNYDDIRAKKTKMIAKRNSLF